MWLQLSKPLKATICTCFLLYVITVLDVLKKKPPDKAHNIDETKSDFSEVKTVVGYSLEHRIAQDLEGVFHCGFEEVEEDGLLRVPEVQGKEEEELVYNEDAGIYVLSSYFDTRLQPFTYVRTVALMPSQLTLFCQIRNSGGKVQVRRATISEIWAKDWDAPKSKFYPAVISCLSFENATSNHSLVSHVLTPCQKPKYASLIVQKSQIFEVKFQKKIMNTVICVKPLNFHKNIGETLKVWVKINFLLGAKKILLYYFNLSNVDINILKPFIDKGLVQFIKFRLPTNLQVGNVLSEKIWFKRKLEILAYNDCFYKNLYQADFVVPLDLDEIIVPKNSENWYEMFRNYFQPKFESDWMKSIEFYSSFSVRNAYFFKKYPTKVLLDLSSKLPFRKNSTVYFNLVHKESSSIFDRKLRSLNYSPKIESVKSFIYVKNSLTIFNHFAFHELKPGLRPMLFPTEVAQLNHYRDICDPILIDNCEQFLNNVTYDNSLERFINKIKER